MMNTMTIAVAAAALLTGASAAVAQQSLPAPPAAQKAFGDAATLAVDDLQDVTGREDIGALIANADQRNTVSNNAVTGTSVTGAISIDGNAFQNLQGMAVISANSGNNVAMNAAMSVTINMAPPR